MTDAKTVSLLAGWVLVFILTIAAIVFAAFAARLKDDRGPMLLMVAAAVAMAAGLLALMLLSGSNNIGHQ